MAGDPATGQLVLFGGATAAGAGGGTWIWNGTTWTRANPAQSPAARSYASVVYDPDVDQLILFGGNTGAGGTPSTSTWIWNGATWIKDSVPAPSTMNPRAAAGMAYDGAGLVMVGGVDGNNYLGASTWTAGVSGG